MTGNSDSCERLESLCRSLLEREHDERAQLLAHAKRVVERLVSKHNSAIAIRHEYLHQAAQTLLELSSRTNSLLRICSDLKRQLAQNDVQIAQLSQEKKLRLQFERKLRDVVQNKQRESSLRLAEVRLQIEQLTRERDELKARVNSRALLKEEVLTRNIRRLQVRLEQSEEAAQSETQQSLQAALSQLKEIASNSKTLCSKCRSVTATEHVEQNKITDVKLEMAAKDARVPLKATTQRVGDLEAENEELRAENAKLSARIDALLLRLASNKLKSSQGKKTRRRVSFSVPLTT